MVVGVATVVLVLPEAGSLKDKRSVAQSVTTRLRARYNVAVAEIDTQDVRDTLTLAIACVSNDARHADAMLQKAVDSLERMRIDAAVADVAIDML